MVWAGVVVVVVVVLVVVVVYTIPIVQGAANRCLDCLEKLNKKDFIPYWDAPIPQCGVFGKTAKGAVDLCMFGVDLIEITSLSVQPGLTRSEKEPRANRPGGRMQRKHARKGRRRQTSCRQGW